MRRLEVENFGPIRNADITFGDLTVFVGPQASGKSLLVQLYKLIRDAGAIRTDLKKYGYDWLHRDAPEREYCSIYFGGGLEGLSEGTKIRRDGKALGFDKLVKPGGRTPVAESTFMIPAQRVLVLQDGWPKPFMAYSEGDPYCMRHFSDALRLLMEQGLGKGDAIFPQPKRLKEELKRLVNRAIYIDARLKLDSAGPRKRIVLTPRGGASALPYSAWSAGQREFTPLLLGLYWLMPPGGVSRKNDIDTVIIEEPEMGLHPQAIISFGLLVLELLERKYRVVLSTHSPVVLDLVWALRELRSAKSTPALGALRAIFDVQRVSPPLKRVFDAALHKSKDYRTYFFERRDGGVVTRDISSLDPGADDPHVSGWGGLSGFSGLIAELVGEALDGASA